ncbi:MAG TPA: hypothetical protein VLT36_11745 [Candidatus Dormibacteraeota bacterium]|nr:hypothetical protein [Candidatus Dormibacteraeota bacterium]
MNPTEFNQRLITLPDGRPGLRTVIQTEVSEPGSARIPAGESLDFISSDATLDRYGEIIQPTGWKLDNYLRNPVFQNAHQYGDILHTLGKATVTEVRAGKLFQRVEFACDVNPIARIAYGLYKGKFLNAVSVGFVPIRWKDASEKSCRRRREETLTEKHECEGIPEEDGEDQSLLTSSPTMKGYGRIFLEQELLEVSAVAICPLNSNRKSWNWSGRTAISAATPPHSRWAPAP